MNLYFNSKYMVLFYLKRRLRSHKFQNIKRINNDMNKILAFTHHLVNYTLKKINRKCYDVFSNFVLFIYRLIVL